MTNGNDTQSRDAMEKELEYLFSETAGKEKGDAETPPEDNGVLNKLKALLLAVDWEINDEIMSGLTLQIAELKTVFREDQILYMFLKLLETIAAYIRSRQANAHPDAVKLLNSVFTSLEIVSLSKAMTPDERKKVLIVEVKKFNRFKDVLTRKKIPAPGSPVKATGTDALRSDIRDAIQTAVSAGLEQIRQVVRDEIRRALSGSRS